MTMGPVLLALVAPVISSGPVVTTISGYTSSSGSTKNTSFSPVLVGFGRVVLTAGDAEALMMTLNGAETKPLGRRGQVVTTRFNLTNFQEYLASR